MKDKTLQDVLNKLNKDILASMSETEGEFEKLSISLRETLQQIKDHKNLDPIVQTITHDIKKINREVREAQTYREFKQFGKQNEILSGIIEKHLEDGAEKVQILGELGKQQKILDENIRRKASIFSRTANFWKRHGITTAAVAGGLLGNSPAVMWAISAWGDYRKLKNEEKELQSKFKTDKLQQVRQHILDSTRRTRQKTFRFEPDEDDFGTEKAEQKRKRVSKKRLLRNKQEQTDITGMSGLAEDLLEKQLNSLINIETSAFNIYKHLQDKSHRDYVEQKDSQSDLIEALLEKDNDQNVGEVKREKEKKIESSSLMKDIAKLAKSHIFAVGAAAATALSSVGAAVYSGVRNAERRGVDKAVGGISAGLKPLAGLAAGVGVGAKVGGMLGGRLGAPGAIIGGAAGALAGGVLEFTSSEEEKRLQAIGLQHAVDQSRLGLSKTKEALYKLIGKKDKAQLENEFQNELKQKQHQRLVNGYWAEKEYNIKNDLKNLEDEYYNAKNRYRDAKTEEERLAIIKQMETADALYTAKEKELKKIEEDNQKRKEENLKREKEIEKLKEEKLKREQYKLEFGLQKKDFMSEGGFKLSGDSPESRAREKELNRIAIGSLNYQEELMKGIRSGKPIDPKTGKRISVIRAGKLLQQAQDKRNKDIQKLVGAEKRSGGSVISAGGLTIPGVEVKDRAPESQGEKKPTVDKEPRQAIPGVEVKDNAPTETTQSREQIDKRISQEREVLKNLRTNRANLDKNWNNQIGKAMKAGDTAEVARLEARRKDSLRQFDEKNIIPKETEIESLKAAGRGAEREKIPLVQPKEPTVDKESRQMIPPVIPGKVEFEQKAPTVMARLQEDLGISREDAAAIVGNLGHESAGLKPDINEGKPVVPGSRGGYGWAQWTGPRRREFEAFAKERNLDITTDEANYQFLVHELKGSEKRSLGKLAEANTLEEKTVAFERAYERAGVKHDDKRIAYAKRAMSTPEVDTSHHMLAMSQTEPRTSELYHQVADSNAVSKIDAGTSNPTIIAQNVGGATTARPPQGPTQAPGMGRGAPRGQEPTIWNAMATDHSGNTA